MQVNNLKCSPDEKVYNIGWKVHLLGLGRKQKTTGKWPMTYKETWLFQFKRPDVNVDWYKGEQALFSGHQEENTKYKRIDDGLQRELIVKNVSHDDQGDYVCQADKYRVTLHLNVQG